MFSSLRRTCIQILKQQRAISLQLVNAPITLSVKGRSRNSSGLFQVLKRFFTSMEGVEIKEVPKNRYEDVLDHITPVFLRDEVLSWSFPTCATGQREKDFREYALSQLESGLCVMATDSSNSKVVGACLNRPFTRSYLRESVKEVGVIEDPMMQHIVRLLTTVHVELDVFKHLGVEELVEIGLVSVDREYTGRGIAKALVKRSLELASEKGYNAAKADCTGVASLKACMKAGMKPLHEQKYCDYKVKGKVIFCNTGDNPQLTVVVAHLPVQTT